MKLVSSLAVAACTGSVGDASAFVPQTTPCLASRTESSSGRGHSMRGMTLAADDNDVGGRRAFLESTVFTTSAAVASTMIFPSNPAAAAEGTQFQKYEDQDCGFQVSVPASWEKSEQALPDRRKIIFYIDPSSASEADKTLLFIAFTPVRDDFTQLSSFGSVDQVGQMTILPKGQIAGEETESKMISAESKKNSYYFDYTSKPPGQPKRHFRTIFSLNQGATGGAGAVLVTLTVQTPEEKYATMKGVFDDIIGSFGKIGAKK